MKQIISILSLFLLATFSINSQVFWTEDFGFGVGCATSQVATVYVGTNGSWTGFDTGANGVNANLWYIGADEQLLGVDQCSTGCEGLESQSLFVGGDAFSYGILATGAFYVEANGQFGVFANTDKRIESPTIDCTGQSTISLNFTYMEGLAGADADPADDNAEVWYFDGTTWAFLDDPAKTPATCAPQGTWTAYTFDLPASADNNPDVKIGFRWTNDDDLIASDPSFAVDDITLSTPTGAGPPVASFGDLPETICAGDLIDMIEDESTTEGTITNWNWTIPDATFDITDPANPADVSWATAGEYEISLVVTDENGTSDPFTFSITVEDCSPEASFTIEPTAICEGETIAFTNTSTFEGDVADVTWAWDFGNTNVSADQNPADETYSDVGTQTITLTITNDYGTDTHSIELVVADCSQPNAIFTVDSDSICLNESVTFTDVSLGTNITDWAWTFVGGTPSDFNGQAPGTVSYDTEGVFEASLIITDDNGVSTPFTMDIVVENCTQTVIVVNASEEEICIGECITFTEASTGLNITGYEWTFEGGSITTSTLQAPPEICYTSGGIFNAILAVTDDNGTSMDTTVITVNSLPAINLVASPGTSICANDMLTLTAEGGDTPTWDNGVTDGVPFSQPVGTTTYVGTVTDDVTTCSNSSEITVTVSDCVAPEAFFGIEGSESICVGDCITYVNLSTGDPDSLIWDFGEFSNPSTFIGENPGQVCYDSTGVFTATLTAINDFGTDIHTFDITVNESPEVIVNITEYLVDFGMSVTMSAASFDDVSYSWSPAQTLDNPFSQSPTSTPIDEDEEQIVYTVTVTDNNGCTASELVTVNVSFVYGLGIPTAFSPNAAAPNNTFGPLGLGFTVHRFVIYNRYGQKVFETSERNDLWDGTLNGKRLNTGTFFWVLDYTVQGETRKTQKGQVSLIH